jgi:integrase
MASAWIIPRQTPTGERRYQVRFRVGGGSTPNRYGGSFKSRRLARVRRDWIAGELAAQRVPDLRALVATVALAPTVREAGKRWLASRIDVADSTRVRLGVDLERVLGICGSRRVDELSPADMADVVTKLVVADYAPSTIKKTREVLAMVLDHAGVDPNPARDRHVKLPRQKREEPSPPIAAHVEAVYRTLPRQHRLAYLWLEWSAARVSSIDKLQVGDYDERLRRVRQRKSITKTGQALWTELPPVLATALEATLPARDDRDPEAELFPGTNEGALRRAITRACVATGTPTFSPHDLRHRRVSVLHAQGRTWAEIAAFVGHASKAETADTYTHVIVDPAEIDLGALLAGR